MSSQADIRAELIQVAAVAIAIVQDLDHGSTELFGTTAWENVFSDVMNERFAQETKWGVQHRDLFRWMAILGEEYGEACQAIVDRYMNSDYVEDVLDLRYEQDPERLMAMKERLDTAIAQIESLNT